MYPQSQPSELILASTSPYRRALLQRLGLPFSCIAPDIEETPLAHEGVAETAARLAKAKAACVAAQFPHAIVIGSDQLAEHAGHAVGKAGTVEKAVLQLMAFSGHKVNFYTGLAVICRSREICLSATDSTEVHFRELTEAEIRRYVEIDSPLDCAGSFKLEAAGSILMRSVSSSDPTALIGLPLISLSGMLRKAGFCLP